MTSATGAWGYDHRDRARDEFSRWVEFYEEDMAGIDGERRSIPQGWLERQVCPTCDGRGSYVNPSIDAGGISGEDFAQWEDDERECYWSGGYDVTCEECHGRNVVDRLSATAPQEAHEAWNQWQQDAWQYAAECAAERRMGA